MSSCLVFNHHSLPYDQIAEAAAAVPEFLRICVRGQRLGLNIVLVDSTVDISWFRVQLAPDYFWQDWYNKNINDGNVRDMIRAFRSIVTRQPFFSHNDMAYGVGLFDVRLVDDNLSYNALRAAAWHNTHIVGFPTRAPWDASPIAVIKESLVDNGEIQLDNLSVINLYSVAILGSVEFSIRNERSAMVRTGKELATNWKELFQHLTLCGKAQEQLASWSHHLSVLSQVKD